MSAEELESSEAQGSRVTVVQISGWCASRGERQSREGWVRRKGAMRI